jgi:hypothetical protein
MFLRSAVAIGADKLEGGLISSKLIAKKVAGVR